MKHPDPRSKLAMMRVQDGYRSYGPYIASKTGVEGLVHVLADELRGRCITVNP